MSNHRVGRSYCGRQRMTRDPLRHGVPLRAFGQGVSPMWLVDGQQRTRAMLDTFEQLLTVPTDSNGWALVREAELESLRSLGHALRLDDVEEDDEEGSRRRC